MLYSCVAEIGLLPICDIEICFAVANARDVTPALEANVSFHSVRNPAPLELNVKTTKIF